MKNHKTQIFKTILCCFLSAVSLCCLAFIMYYEASLIGLNSGKLLNILGREGGAICFAFGIFICIIVGISYYTLFKKETSPFARRFVLGWGIASIPALAIAERLSSLLQMNGIKGIALILYSVIILITLAEAITIIIDIVRNFRKVK